MSPMLLLVMSILFFGLFSFMWLWWCERAKRKQVEEAVDVLGLAVDKEHEESQRFHRERDEARAECTDTKRKLDSAKFDRDESNRLYAAILGEWTEAKKRFGDTLEASEMDRMNARASYQDMKTERDFHHTAHDAAVADRDEMQKKLQQKEQELQFMSIKYRDLEEKYNDICSKIDILKRDAEQKYGFIGDYTKNLS